MPEHAARADPTGPERARPTSFADGETPTALPLSPPSLLLFFSFLFFPSSSLQHKRRLAIMYLARVSTRSRIPDNPSFSFLSPSHIALPAPTVQFHIGCITFFFFLGNRLYTAFFSFFLNADVYLQDR